MGRKRRGSQAFTFDQSEETLKQNESIVNLYQNKTFQPPEPQPIETINEAECVTGFFRIYFKGFILKLLGNLRLLFMETTPNFFF